jgi:predicted nucleic acid-binding protein
LTGRFIDTNIILRYLLNDHPTQSPASAHLIGAIAGGLVQAWTTDLVIAEAVWVLSNPRNFTLSRTDIRDLLLPIIGLPDLDVPSKALYVRIFDFYTSLPIDFIDAYNAAHAELQSPPAMYSYDRHFDRVPTVTRLEP